MIALEPWRRPAYRLVTSTLSVDGKTYNDRVTDFDSFATAREAFDTAAITYRTIGQCLIRMRDAQTLERKGWLYSADMPVRDRPRFAA